MNELVQQLAQPVGIGALVFTCLCLVRMLNGKIKNKVSRPECHSAQDGIKQRIDDFQKHIDNRFDDVKDLIKKNSK